MKHFIIKHYLKLLLLIICVSSVIIRIPTFEFPLDYDVGGHLFYGSLVAESGYYSTLQEIRTVGMMSIFSAIYRIFGASCYFVHASGALMWVISSFFVYKITDLLSGSKKTSLLATIFFVIFSANRVMQGEMANLEVFFIPFSLAGIYFYFLYKSKKKLILLFFSGFLLGYSFLIKQLAGFELASVVIFNFIVSLFVNKSKLNVRQKIIFLFLENVILFLGFVAPTVIYLVYFFFKGQSGEFLHYQYLNIFNQTKGYEVFGTALQNFKDNFKPIFLKTKIFWIMFVGGIFTSIIFNHWKNRLFLFIWLIIDFAGIYYLWWFFNHHFLQLTPHVSIISAFFIFDIFIFLEKRVKKFKSKNIVFFLILFIAIFNYLITNYHYFSDYNNFLRKKITKNEYLSKSGFNVGEDGWGPYYESAEYIKKNTKKEDTLFIWGSVHFVYTFADKIPVSYYVYQASLLPDELRSRAYIGWFPEYKKNREVLMEELITKKPDYILFQVSPSRIFNEMFDFPIFSSFVYFNYDFSKSTGNSLLFKIKDKNKIIDTRNLKEPLVPLEIIKRFCAITKLSKEGKQNLIEFQPMVNLGGILKTYTLSYPNELNIKFEEINKIEFAGWDGKDYTSGAEIGPNGTEDLHLKIKNSFGQVKFVRVKNNDSIWNNRLYGVNVPLVMFQDGEVIDIYLETSKKLNDNKYELYIIFEDGTLATSVFTPQ